MKRIISMVLSLVMLVSLLGVNVSSEWTEPTENTSLYSWPTAPTAENIFGGSGAFEKNAGTWSSMTDTTASFVAEDADGEPAILMNNPTGEGDVLYDYFSHDLGGAITQGKVEVTFSYKTNGSRFGVILDSGDPSTSTVAYTSLEYGEWADASNPPGYISVGKFPWPGSDCWLKSYGGLGTHTDDGFGQLWTITISANLEEHKYNLTVKRDGAVIGNLPKYEFDMTQTQIRRIVFAQAKVTTDKMTWDVKTYVKNINIDYKKIWKAPTTDTNLYSWPSEPTADNIWNNGLENNAGSASDYTYINGTASKTTFDIGEKALLLNNDGTKESLKCDFFSYNIGGAITKGQIDLSFKFKTNGTTMGVFLGNGTYSTSTTALTITPWGENHIWEDGVVKVYSGKIGYEKFPWAPTSLKESLKLGQHSDDGFGEWLTVEISARPQEKKYTLTVKDENNTVIAYKSGIEMTAAQTQIQDIAFVQLDEMPWNAKTYVKDIKVDYKNYMSAGITSVKNANDEEVTDISKASGKLTISSQMINTFGENRNYTVIAAAYDSDNRLISVQMGEVHSGSADAEFSDEFDFGGITASKIKLFAWGDNIKPFDVPKTISATE